MQTKTLTAIHFISTQLQNVQKFKLTKNFFFGLIFLLIGTTNSFATDYYQRQSGNWNNPSTWTTETQWPQTANTGTYPQAGDNIHIANNGHSATITLTADAECANLYFDGSEPAPIIAMGNYNLVVTGTWTIGWSSNATISQGTGYLQINGGIPQFNTAKTVTNFRVGSGSFYFTQTNDIKLTVTSNYDYNCFQSTIPTGIDATNATKINRTPCYPVITVSALSNFGNVCTGSTTSPYSFTITGAALNNSNVTVSALAGFTYSTTADGTYSSTLSIPQPGDSLIQVIYVKFNPTTSTSYNGNIVVGGGGAPNVNIAASGNGSTSVTPSVGSVTSSNITSSSATLGATISIAGCAESVTERGFYYSTTSGFANGSGTKVSETGTFGTCAYTINVTGLSASTTYYYKAFATNSNGTTYSSQGTFNNIPQTYYSRQSGNWTSPSTWTTAGCWQTLNQGTYPKAFDNVVICNENQISINEPGLSCNNLNMDNYLGNIILNNDFRVYGNVVLTNHNYISVGSHNLTIDGNFSNTPNGYNARIDYSSGNVSIGGNITVDKNGLEPFNCTGDGWVILTGESKTITTNSNIVIPNLQQPVSGFAKSGSGVVTISDTFDQNMGPDAPQGVTISIPGNTTGVPIKQFRSQNSGNWNSTSTWQLSNNDGASWGVATSTPETSNRLVIIQNGHTVAITANTGASELTINTGGTLTVNAGKQLTVRSALTNNGILQLLSNVNGTATILTQGSITGNGTYKVQQYLNTNRNWYLTSPIANATAPSGYTYFKYDEPGNNSGFVTPATAYWESIAIGATLNPLVGFITQPSSGSSTIEFSGTTLNNGDKSATLTRTAGKNKEGFHLIGNPYPSYVNWEAATKTNLEPTIWYRTKNNAGNYVYDTFNGVGTNNNQNGAVTGYIPPMQSFWVRVSATKTSGSLKFTNAMRIQESGTNRLKAPSNVRNENKILRLQISNTTNSDETLVVFNENASNSFDVYDAQKMTNGNSAIPEIFTMADNEELTINGMNSASVDTEITLGFRTGETNNFSIKASEISNFDDNTHIILRDELLNNETDLSMGEAYNFSSGATTTTNRFSLIFRTSSITTNLNNNSTNNSVIAYKNLNGNIIVKVNDKIINNGTIQLYNSTGQKLASYIISTQTTVIDHNFKPGIYFINITTNGKTTTQKLIID